MGLGPLSKTEAVLVVLGWTPWKSFRNLDLAKTRTFTFINRRSNVLLCVRRDSSQRWSQNTSIGPLVAGCKIGHELHPLWKWGEAAWLTAEIDSGDWSSACISGTLIPQTPNYITRSREENMYLQSMVTPHRDEMNCMFNYFKLQS